jgi:hypothetical protein
VIDVISLGTKSSEHEETLQLATRELRDAERVVIVAWSSLHAKSYETPRKDKGDRLLSRECARCRGFDGIRVGNQLTNTGWGATAKRAPSAGVRHALHEASFVSIVNAFLKGHHSKAQNAVVELQITLTQPPCVSPRF